MRDAYHEELTTVSDRLVRMADAAGVDRGPGGRVPVGPHLTIAGHPEVHVIGDMAAIEWPDGPPGRDEVRALLLDLCTPAELEALSDRWRVVPLLLEGLPYREIRDITAVSVTTIGRVARCLGQGAGGYRRAHVFHPAPRHGQRTIASL